MAICKFYRIAEGRSFRYDPEANVPLPYHFTYGVCVKEKECDRCYCDGNEKSCDYENHDCGDCKYFDEPDEVCRSKKCHRAYTCSEIESMDVVTDAWEKRE